MSNKPLRTIRFTVRVSQETYEALNLFAHTLTDGLRTTTKAAVVEYLVKKALEAERGKPYLPIEAPAKGKFLPDVQMPTTKSDMAFQLWQAKKTCRLPLTLQWSC